MIGVHEDTAKFFTCIYLYGECDCLSDPWKGMLFILLVALFMKSSLRVSAQHQHILFFGWLRARLPLALALGLPHSIPCEKKIVTVALCVVLFSILIQA